MVGAPGPEGGVPTYYSVNLSRNCMKMKDFEPGVGGGGTRP